MCFFNIGCVQNPEQTHILTGTVFFQPFQDSPKLTSDPTKHSYPRKVPEEAVAVPIGGGPAFATGVYISGVKYITGFSMYEGTKSIPFHIGVRGKSDNGQCEVLSWGISAEVFYL